MADSPAKSCYPVPFWAHGGKSLSLCFNSPPSLCAGGEGLKPSGEMQLESTQFNPQYLHLRWKNDVRNPGQPLPVTVDQLGGNHTVLDRNRGSHLLLTWTLDPSTLISSSPQTSRGSNGTTVFHIVFHPRTFNGRGQECNLPSTCSTTEL